MHFSGGVEPVKKLRLLLLVGALIAPIALGQIYKWVDEEGEVHFGDCPPEECVFEELSLPEGPSDEEIKAAQEELSRTLDSRRVREAEAAKKKETDSLEIQREEELEAERFRQCVEAIYQLELLNQKRPIFKLSADRARLYLEDEDRPNEISRLTILRDEYCSTDPGARNRQLERAQEIGIALSRSCDAAHEAIERMQQPGANPDEIKLERHLLYVEAFCPGIESNDLWLGDWIRVRKQR